MHRQQTSAEYLTPRERCGAPHRKKIFRVYFIRFAYIKHREVIICVYPETLFRLEAHQLNEPFERYDIFHHKLCVEHRKRGFEPDNAP